MRGRQFPVAAVLRFFMLASLLRHVLVYQLMVGTAYAALPPAAAANDSLHQPRFESVGAGAIPRSVVPALAQDSAGLIWVATGDGLVRFDGYVFRAQERASVDVTRRNLGWIRSLLAGRDGRLWIGTETDGLAVYDPMTENIQDFGMGAETIGDGTPAALPTIRALCEDGDGNIWVGSLGGGLSRFDVTGKRFTHYRNSLQAGGLPDDRVLAVLAGRNGTIWVGAWNGLSRLVRGSTQFEPVAPHRIGPQVQALYEATDGRIWVGTQQGVLMVIDPLTAQASTVSKPVNANLPGPVAVTAFAQVPSGEMWVGTASGIDIYDRNQQFLNHLRHDIRNPAGLAGHEVTTLILDRAGWLWVGGFGLGLQRHNPNNRSIWLRGADLAPGSPLADPSVRSLLQLDNGEIWAAAQRGGVAVMDAALRVVGEVSPRPASRATKAATAVGQVRAEGTVSPQVTAMAQTQDGSVWLGTSDTLYQFSRDHRQIRSLPTPASPRVMLAASDGVLWIATQEGLYLLHPTGTSLVRVGLGGGRPLGGAIHVLAEAADKGLWVGTAQGLFRVPPGRQELQPVVSPAGAGLGNASIAGLLVDPQDVLWVDTGVAGLHRMSRWDGHQASFDRISERHGIVNRPFGSNLLADARGRIWTQIHVYDPATDRLSDLTAVDGADLGTGWFGSYTQTSDGRMLFGGSKGVLVVRPELFDTSDYAPPLVVSELRINGERQSAGEALTRGLQITPEQRSFSLEFAALDYSDPLRVRYAYRLDGFDPDWINGRSNNRVASYSNLDPGEYVLQVRATNRSGVWSPNELALTVQVLPAWWQQWWFRALAIALTLALIYCFVQLRTRRLLQDRLALELKVEKRTAELTRLTAALNESSLTDPLTGLRNRRFVAEHIAADAALVMRAHETRLQRGAALAADADMLFFMFDIDHFKEVNDQHGHAAGDAVLAQMRSRLEAVFRDTDYLVRWGGEEFLVVARGTSRQVAPELAERARAAVANSPFALEGGLLVGRTCSVGFAAFPLCTRHPLALSWDAVLNVADASLYAVKKAGRNGWLGVLDVPNGSLQSVQVGARQSIADWAGSGDLAVASSASLVGWSAAKSEVHLDGTNRE